MTALRYDPNLRAFVNEDKERLKREHADAILRERRAEYLRSEEHEAWHRFFKRMAGQESEAERIIQQMKEMRQ